MGGVVFVVYVAIIIVVVGFGRPIWSDGRGVFFVGLRAVMLSGVCGLLHLLLRDCPDSWVEDVLALSYQQVCWCEMAL